MSRPRSSSARLPTPAWWTRCRRSPGSASDGVDISVSNAARRLFKDFWETTDDDWHEYLNQQLTASWYLAKAFAPAMRDAGWGRFIHMNGADGYTGGWTRIPHSTAKGGLRTLTKSLASGLARHGITVNDVDPGYADTERDPTTHPFLISEQNRARAASGVPLGRPTRLDRDRLRGVVPVLGPGRLHHRLDHPRRRRPLNARVTHFESRRPHSPCRR